MTTLELPRNSFNLSESSGNLEILQGHHLTVTGLIKLKEPNANIHKKMRISKFAKYSKM